MGSRRDAIGVLERAFELGITHFDVARLYGSGQAESVLGEFLRGKRDKVTVATKFGLLPPGGLAGNRWIINAAKKILAPFPALLQSLKKQSGPAGNAPAFKPDVAVHSLETSLRELGTEYVDLLLLHEATLDDANSQALIDLLQRQVETGTVRFLGVASDFGRIDGDGGRLPEPYHVLQCNDNVTHRNLSRLSHRASQGLVTFSVFEPLQRIAASVPARPGIADRFSALIGADVCDPQVIGSLLLGYALRSNPDGVVLFSTVDRARIGANVREVESPMWNNEQLDRFVEFVDEILNVPAFSGGVRP